MFQTVAYVVKVKISLVKSQDNWKLESMARKVKATYVKFNTPTHEPFWSANRAQNFTTACNFLLDCHLFQISEQKVRNSQGWHS